MNDLPNCPQCDSNLTYQDGALFVCPMCAHEWTETDKEVALDGKTIYDSNGKELADGDHVTVIRDIKLKGSSRLKQGTKATNIRLLSDPINDHDIECTVDGFGRMYLKSELVKKN